VHKDLLEGSWLITHRDSNSENFIFWGEKNKPQTKKKREKENCLVATWEEKPQSLAGR